MEAQLERFEERYEILERETQKIRLSTGIHSCEKLPELEEEPDETGEAVLEEETKELKSGQNSESDQKSIKKISKKLRFRNLKLTNLEIDPANISVGKGARCESAGIPKKKNQLGLEIGSQNGEKNKCETLSNLATPKFRASPGCLELGLRFSPGIKQCVLCSKNLHPVFENLGNTESENKSLR